MTDLMERTGEIPRVTAAETQVLTLPQPYAGRHRAPDSSDVDAFWSAADAAEVAVTRARLTARLWKRVAR